MKKFLSALVAVACAVLVFGAVGCGPKAPYRVVPVEGSVEWRGEPLVGATLTFTPIETDGRPSKATTREGGKFVAKHTPSIQGVPAGKIRLTVLYYEGGSKPGEERTVPEKYRELAEKYGPGTDGYEFELKKAQHNFKIELE